MSKLYTVPEVAAIYRVKPATVYAWIRSNQLGAVRIGRLIRITETQLAAFIHTSAADLQGART